MSYSSQTSKPVIFIGAADAICQEAIKVFASATDVPIILADKIEEDLRAIVDKLPGQNITFRAIDIHNSEQLRELIAGAALVVQGAQPYYPVSTPIITACIDAKVPYLDYSDDVKSTRESLDLHERAKKEGVACYINCGSSPGMTNLLAVEIAEELDTVDTLDVCWLVSEEGGELGREVLEHLMHITGGDCLTWAEKKAMVHENWVETAFAPIDDGNQELFYESVHPEPVTLPRRLPNVNRIRTLGALNPAPFNGFARGLGAAVNSGRLSMDAAVDFLDGMNKESTSSWSEVIAQATAQLRGGDITLNQLCGLVAHGSASSKPWNLAIWGMIDQVRTGKCTAVEVLQFLVNSARGKKSPPRSGLLVRGVGLRNGNPTVVIKRTRKAPLSQGQGMAASIGTSCAVFALLALENESQRYAGVNCPEDWTSTKRFFGYLEKLGCPRDQMLEEI